MNMAIEKHAVIELVREGLDRGLSMNFKVQSESMRPYLRAGDVVSVKPADPHSLRKGDLIMFQSGDLMIVHRVLGESRGEEGVMLVTKGDANPHNDPPVHHGRVMGRVVKIERNGLRLDLDSLPMRVVSRIFAVVSPMSRYYMPVASRIKRSFRGIVR
ncbi:MAG: signal peptidase I [Myxococcota bacterium]|jgi:signal peptidase I